MIRRIPIRSGNALLCELADSLDLLQSNDEISSSLLDVSREFAFSSDSADEFAHWYLRSECFSKFRSSGETPHLVEAALAKFQEAELLAARANERLVDPWTRHSLDQRVWRRARGIASRVLGRFPWESFPWHCRFGPGASGSLRRTDASHQKKWAASAHITEGAVPYHHAFVRWSTLDVPNTLELVEGNRVTTVPKSYKTDRTIAIEPDWNMFYQLGVGSLIRQRLQRVGLLLREAQEINRGLAKLGSWTGSLATLDLSMASDSVSLAVCEAILPDEWLQVLLDLRSPEGELPDGTRITYAKVSSMGNGFTFELETLIFYCLVLAVCGKGNEGRISVYGDDIICPSEHATEVAAVLNQAGFELNGEKSFWEGPFRESCGGHFWRGSDVTPYYVRHTPTTQGDLIVMGNHLVSWLSCRETPQPAPFRRIYNSIKRKVPRSLWGPWGLDGVLWADWDSCRPKWSKDHQCYKQLTVRREHRYIDVSDWAGSYLHKLWINSPDAETSWLARPLTKEVFSKVSVDRESWSMLPVRIA